MKRAVLILAVMVLFGFLHELLLQREVDHLRDGEMKLADASIKNSESISKLAKVGEGNLTFTTPKAGDCLVFDNHADGSISPRWEPCLPKNPTKAWDGKGPCPQGVTCSQGKQKAKPMAEDNFWKEYLSEHPLGSQDLKCVTSSGAPAIWYGAPDGGKCEDFCKIAGCDKVSGGKTFDLRTPPVCKDESCA